MNGCPKAAIALVLGSGLGPFAGAVDGQDEFPYQDFSKFPVTTVPACRHANFGGWGRCGVAMKGRFHHMKGMT
jgi:purine-nucleoside phosphorylase